MQSRLEAMMMMTELMQATVEYKNMLSDLVIFEGGAKTVDSLSGVLQFITRSYQLHDLIELAQDNRTDLKAAIYGRELSAANLRLAKANRMIDLGLNIGFAHHTVALNEEAPSPRFNTISTGISIPLPFSAINKGEVRAAQYYEKQAEVQYNAILLQIRKEVEQRYNNYISALRQAEIYQRNTLADATMILEKKKFSYSRGETSLLEVLNSQRTENEIFKNYYEVLFNVNASLVELCRVVGIWDVEF
jgi:cobalt-zinc-cadmium efflux system outer membrane protein